MLYFKKKEKIIINLVFITVLVCGAFGENHTVIEENIACEKIQSSEFPEDLFTKTQKKFGAIILHVIFAVYCFGAIAIVCCERFLPIISCICEDLKLSDDVAAATFMSIATSAPELFSNIIGTFITESDIGIGHVIGNGYYNMFVVAAVGGVAASKKIILEWWPLTRDCSIYAVFTLILTGIVWDGVVQIYEAVILLLLYFVYFFIMFNNKKIFNFILRKSNTGANSTPKNEANEITEVNNEAVESEKEKMTEAEETEPLEAEHDFTLLPPPVPSASKVMQTIKVFNDIFLEAVENERWIMTKKIFTMPINFLMRYTIPDVRVKKFRKYYPVAFVICVAWIGVSTYLGTWMISVIGDTIGVPDVVMGLIFMAAGGSVVETYSVYYKAKQGHCSIGLSNSIGCNNLDITLCLALPWLFKTLPIKTLSCKNVFSSVILESSLIHLNCLLSAVSVVSLFLIFYLNQFELDKKLGMICGGLYSVVLFIAISIESYSNSD